jgi:hypothetical protein
MTLFLPNIRPNQREFVCADYPVSANEWRGSVAYYPRLWSSTPVSAKLQLTYSNIPDSLAVQFVRLWYNSLSGALPIALPESVTYGIDDEDLIQRILYPTGLAWRFAQEPSVSNIAPRLSTVQINLVAEAEPYVPTP